MNRIIKKTYKISLLELTLLSFLSYIYLSELLYYFGYKDYFIMTPNRYLILSGMIFVMVLLTCFRTKVLVPKGMLIFLVFTFWMMLSTLLAYARGIMHFKWMLGVTLFASFLFGCYYIQNKFKNNSVIKVFQLIFIVVLAIFILFTFIAVRDVERNTIYYLLCFVPFISFFKSKGMRGFLSAMIFLLVILFKKRTALIAFAAYCIVSEIVNNKAASLRQKFRKVLLYLLLSVVLYLSLTALSNVLDFGIFERMRNISKDDGNGRLLIYAELFAKQFQSGWLHWIFGDGYNAVLVTGAVGLDMSTYSIFNQTTSYLSAHNDFLEVLFDYGIIGLVLYLGFFVFLIKKALRMVKNRYPYANAFLASIVMVIVISSTSHLIIYLNYYAVIMAFWGYCISDEENHVIQNA